MPQEDTIASHDARRAGGSNPWGPRIGFIALGVLLAAAVFAYATLYFGHVEGEEFAPQVFQRRHFSYYEIPLFGIQISPIHRKNNTSSLEAYLVAEKMLILPKAPQPRWDLVFARRGLTLAGQGDAQILCRYLDAEDTEGKNIWLQWTKNRADLGRVLWPAVAKVAEQELYVFVPDLLALPHNATDPASLKDQINAMLAEKYLSLADIQQRLDRHDAAVELYTEVLARVPDKIEAFQSRAQSLESLGKADKAAADLAQANKLGGRF